ncbi:MAG TPA: hypothetical protein VGF13_02370 [Verrucomicrobiae bacterium]
MAALPTKFDSALQKLREEVLASPALLKRLRATSDRETFVAETLRVAAELDLEVTAADVENALRAARQECIEFWD